MNRSIMETVEQVIQFHDSTDGNKHASFNHLNFDELTELIEYGILDPDECQNSSLTVKEFMDIMYTTGFTAHGYVISKYREDHRVTIEGIDGIIAFDDYDGIQAVVNGLHHADEFNFTAVPRGWSVRSWWD